MSPQNIVLIVEDEFLIRMTSADFLRDSGFEIIEAGNAEEAWNQLEKNPDIKLVFTDFYMPGEDGLNFVHRASQRWSQLRFLLTSGHRSVKKSELPHNSGFIHKPYRYSELELVMCGMIDCSDMPLQTALSDR